MSVLLSPRFLTMTAQLRAFVAETGRLPRQSCAPTPRERALGDFLRVQRMRARHPERASNHRDAQIAHLDAEVPGWLVKTRAGTGKRGLPTPFEKSVRAVAAYVSFHDSFPTGASSAPELSTFLMNQRQAAKGRGTTAWSPERGQMMDRLIPGWRTPAGPGRTFEQNLEEISAFVAEHARRPRLSSTCPHERRLAGVISRTKTHEQRLALGQVVPGYTPRLPPT